MYSQMCVHQCVLKVTGSAFNFIQWTRMILTRSSHVSSCQLRWSASLARHFSSAATSSNLRPPTASDISHLQDLVSNVLVADKDDLSHYNNDWFHTVSGHSNVVLRPNNTQEVAKAVKYCNANYIPISIQGGNTGVAGGSVPVDSEALVHEEIDTVVFDYVQEMRGSISGEHGLGTLKRNQIFYSKPALAVDYMKHLKGLFDPRGILNPGKVLPDVIPPESELP